MAENMSSIAPNNYAGVRSSGFRLGVIMHGLLTLAILTTQQAQAAVECEAFRWEPERLDYNAAKDRRRISQVESHHFDARVESLVRGQTGRWPGGDIDFLVRYSPNHHRGLAALVRLSLRDKTPKPVGVNIPVECYLLRALEFTPSDAEIHKIYGTYLARLGRDPEAIAKFEQAEKLTPDDPVIAYNLGLLLTEKRDFERARMYAEKAYAGGLQLPGLRDKLARQGQWR
jgi:tetratricopeptide (TPR) repeat protein